MNMLILKNEGEIDINVITTMGVTIKNCENPIGFFGTGLKYAIAVLLRNNIDLELFIGRNKYSFFTENQRIRNEEFKVCKMVGNLDSLNLGFTTDLGRNWEVWQAYREIESNCRDEGGHVYKADGEPKGEEGYTKFILRNLPDVGEVFLNKGKRNLILRNKDIEIFEGESNVIFYRSIRAKDLNTPSKYTYNILKKSHLTEDRLLCYDWQVEEIINDAIAKMENEDVIKDVITSKDDSYESRLSMSYNSTVAPGPTFLKTYKENKTSSNASAKEFVKKHEPPVPKTMKEKAADFRRSLDDLCKSYNLSYDIDRDGYISIVACDLLNPREMSNG